MAAPGVTSIKTFTYRDGPEEWSNRYHFTGSAPSSPADWRSLCDDLVDIEKAVISDLVQIVRFLCYEDTDNDSVYTYDLTAYAGAVTGTFSASSSAHQMSGDVAYDVRWNTGRITSKGKPIYLRKYFHGGLFDSSDRDKPDSSLLTAMGTFGAAVETSSGDWPGLAGPDGTAPIGYLAMPYLTTRTLKRRGRRP